MRWLSSVVLVLSMALACPSSGSGAEPAGYVPDELLIKYRTDIAPSQRAIESLPMRSIEHIGSIDVDHVRLPEGVTVEQALSILRQDPRVEYAEPNYYVRACRVPNDPLYPSMHALHNTGQNGGTPGADIGAPAAWDVTTGDIDLMIGLIDTGIDTNHLDLSANLWTNPDEGSGLMGVDDDSNGLIDDIHGYDFANNDGNPIDDSGHGTFMCGVMAAEGNNSIGVTGVMWHSRVVAIKSLSGISLGTIANVIKGIQYASSLGLRVVCGAWGTDSSSVSLLNAINTAGAGGMLFVTAAGNDSRDIDAQPFYPASFNSPYLLTVGASTAGDSLADFSNFGVTSVDLVAPGVDVLTTDLGGRYLATYGTSLAAAHVAGTCALVLSAFPAFNTLDLRLQIIRSAASKPWLQGLVASAGRLDAAHALAGPDIAPPDPVTDLTVIRPTSSELEIRWTAPGDDGATGRATRYHVRLSAAPITNANFDSARVLVAPTPSPAGQRDSTIADSLTFSTTYYFAVKAEDDYGNLGPLSNIATGTTLAAPDIAVTPGVVSTSVVTGGIRTRSITIQNTGPGTLDFAVTAPRPVAPQTAVSHGPRRAKGEAAPKPGAPVVESSGGPDAFGYIWSDSDEPGGPSFGWVDITGVGQLLTLNGSTDEGWSNPIAMGMQFPFYGGFYDTLWAYTNGYLSFHQTDPLFSNDRLPSTIGTATMIAPFWDDLDLTTGGHIYAYNDGVRLIISWIDVPHWYAGGPYSFQVLLYPSGEIRYQYLTLGTPVIPASVGLQNETRDVGLAISHQSAYLHDNLAVRIRVAPQWLTVTPRSGRVGPGQQQQISLRFDGTGLPTGFFDSNFSIASNDPDEPSVPVLAHLHVVGAPDIEVHPITVAFDSVSIAAVSHRTLVVANTGARDLVIYNLTSDRAAVTVSPSSFSVPPGLARNVDVRFAPTAAGALDGALTLWSNDPDAPAQPVALSGTGYFGARLAVVPESLQVQLRTNQVATRTLRVTNFGGVDLNFTATPILPSEPRSATKRPGADPAVGAVGKDARNSPEAALPEAPLEPTRSGGPDAFGYTFSDSDDPGGPVFDWIDVRSTGTLIPISDDDEISARIPVGFAFPFYGQYFDSVRIATNGFLSFTSTLTSFTNSTLPSNGATVPENLLAVLWDDLNFRGLTHVWVQSDGHRLVVQYQDVARGGETVPNTFEVVLREDGTIVYQYLALATPTRNSNTIGIQNATRTVGLLVSYNTVYLHDGLAVRLRPPARFLSVSPAAATIPPGQFVDLDVQFDAFGLVGGLYEGKIRLASNDEVDPIRDVPCRLTVIGAPDIAISPAALAFDDVFVGYALSRSIRVANLGSAPLNVTAVQSSDPAYGVDASSFVLTPHTERTLQVTFTPGTARSYPATLTLVSDDPDSPNLPVPITGTALVPPAIHVTPASIATALATSLGPEARTRTKPVVIENSGGSPLTWRIAATTGASPTLAKSSVAPTDEALDVQPAKGDPGRPGAPQLEAAGGPDEFGYAWEDSHQPGGPVFAWVDISASGTRVPFARDDQNSGPIALPFSFPFYGDVFTGVRVCTNGWLSFTSGDTTYHNVQLPNAGTRSPENLIAPFWEDLDFRVGGNVYTHYDGQRFIVSWVDAPHWIHDPGIPPGFYTFQVILSPNGVIDFQYLNMQGVVNSATVGTQNAAKDVGLTVSYNAAYVENGLRVRIQRRSNWLAVVPDSGVTAPGERDTVEARFDATGLPDDDYTGALRVTSNDPATPFLQVPVTLHVGVAVGTLTLNPEFPTGALPPGWVDVRITPPGTPCRPDLIVPSSLRALGTVPLAPGAPFAVDGCAMVANFERLDLLQLAPAGAQSIVGVSGEIADVTWFVARDTISMLRPVIDTGDIEIPPNTRVALTWRDAPGSPPSRYDFWVSSDGGGSWTRISRDDTLHAVSWLVPSTPISDGWFEVVAHAISDGAYVGSGFSQFQVLVGPVEKERIALAVPVRFALTLSGPNPAQGTARLDLALPTNGPVDVRVYDVRGALVRRLASGEHPAGHHPLVWDGLDDSGRPVHSGMYFAQATTRGTVAGARFALIR